MKEEKTIMLSEKEIGLIDIALGSMVYQIENQIEKWITDSHNSDDYDYKDIKLNDVIGDVNDLRIIYNLLRKLEEL